VKKIIVAAIVAALFAACATVQAPRPAEPAPAAAAPQPAAKNADLATWFAEHPAVAFPTIDYSLYDRWYRTEPALSIIPTKDRIVRGHTVYVPLVFAPTGEENVDGDVVFDVTVLDPTGAEVTTVQDMPGIRWPFAPRMFYLSDSVFHITLGDEHPSGRYRFRIGVHEAGRTKALEIETSIELVDAMDSPPFGSDEFAPWLTFYYQDMTPHRAVEGLEFFMDNWLETNPGSAISVMGFYVELLRNNEVVVDEVIRRFPLYNDNSQRFILLLFHFAGSETTEQFTANLTGRQQRAYSQIRAMDDEYVTDPLLDPSQLDYLWGEFFAAGRFQSIRTIITAFNLAESNPQVYGAAEWSVASNSDQHMLVRQYCLWTYLHGDITPAEREALRRIIGLDE